jgi:flagellar protein FliO/FliZ
MDFWESLIRMVAALGVVLGLLMAALAVLKRFQRMSGLASSTGPMIRVVGSSPLDPRKSIAVVEVGQDWLVVGVTPTDIVPLGRMPRGEVVVASSAPAPAGAGER